MWTASERIQLILCPLFSQPLALWKVSLIQAYSNIIHSGFKFFDLWEEWYVDPNKSCWFKGDLLLLHIECGTNYSFFTCNLDTSYYKF